MAQTQDFPRECYSDNPIPRFVEHPMATATTIPAGALVCRNSSGYAVNASTSATLKTLGVCEKNTVNSGSNGAKNVRVCRGVFPFKNSASGDLITIADVGNDCYIVDNETVAKTDDTGARSVAGKVEFIRDGLVWVRVGVH
jgi:hypothetical protein